MHRARRWQVVGVGPHDKLKLKLIVGLGNPGPEYSDTRHNVGFWVADELAKRHQAKFRQSARWQARTARIAGDGAGDHGDVLLAEPMTFMNLSGRAVRELVTFYKIEIADMLVMVDDADLPLGKLRIRMGGSAGGHNGLKSIIQELGTQQFSRLRIGVGRQAGGAEKSRARALRRRRARGRSRPP